MPFLIWSYENPKKKRQMKVIRATLLMPWCSSCPFILETQPQKNDINCWSRESTSFCQSRDINFFSVLLAKKEQLFNGIIFMEKLFLLTRCESSFSTNLLLWGTIVFFFFTPEGFHLLCRVPLWSTQTSLTLKFRKKSLFSSFFFTSPAVHLLPRLLLRVVSHVTLWRDDFVTTKWWWDHHNQGFFIIIRKHELEWKCTKFQFHKKNRLQKWAGHQTCVFEMMFLTVLKDTFLETDKSLTREEWVTDSLDTLDWQHSNRNGLC